MATLTPSLFPRTFNLVVGGSVRLVAFGIGCWIAFLTPPLWTQSTEPANVDELLNEAAVLTQKADYAHALPLLRRAAELAPLNASANFQLGQALFQSGHPADALAPLQIAAKADPSNEAAFGYLGDAEMEANNFAQAAEVFQAAVAHSPNSEQALLWWTDYSLERYRVLAFSLRATRKGRAAVLKVGAENTNVEPSKREGLLRQAAELDPNLSGIWGDLGIAQAQLSLDAKAEATLKTAQRHDPGASSTLELEAMVEASHANWPQSEAKLASLSLRSRSLFQKTLIYWPRTLVPGPNVNGKVWNCLREHPASCQLKFHEPEQSASANAAQLFEEERWEQLSILPDPNPGRLEEWFWRGVAFAETGDCSRAIFALERGLQAGAESAAALLAHCYELQAVQTADQLNIQGREASVHQIRGDILLSIRLDAQRAAAEYTEALRLKPNDPQLQEKLAEACFSLGDMERARQNARAALKHNPSRTQLLRLMIRIAMSQRDYSTALDMLSGLAAQEPDDPWARVQKGTAYAQTGHAEEAVEQLKPALDAGYADEKGALHALLAAQLRKLGRNQEATIASQQAIKLADAFQQQEGGKAPLPR
jgi:tetratricopeptide (TPR) repeat protein